MTFLRVVEVFPPIIQSGQGKSHDLEAETQSFIEGVSRIRDYADLVLVANLKDPKLVTVPPTVTASLLVAEAGVNAAPVVVVRDSSRKEIASTMLGAYSLGLKTLMLAWGDRPVGSSLRRAGDFASLSQVLAYAREISRLAHVEGRFLAPVDLDRLSTLAGVNLAKSRLKSGAALLLAQPPTADPNETLDAHLALLGSSGLRRRVLLSVFPFRDRNDVLWCEKHFGWKLPGSLKRNAAMADYAPIDEARAVAERLREEGMPGLYLSTRGSPEIARQILA
jgi:5,10-methylenetetrahydrofolate reductase